MPANSSLRDRFERGLAAPICLTWELTYACNLACTHCLSSSGRRDPMELTTDEAKALIDEIASMQIFYINIGGGEPMIRRDFFELIEHAVSRKVGVKFSTNGTRIDEEAAKRLATIDYLDIQISIDGVDAETSDRIRGAGSYDAARRAMDNLRAANFGQFKISVVMTRESVEQLDEFEALARHYGAELRLTRLRPSGRGVDVWEDLHPTLEQNRRLYRWLLDRPNVLTGDSFFHLSALGQSLEGLNLCGAGRVVCLIDPVGEVYACPFVIHDEFKAGNVREGGFGSVWTNSELFRSLREPGSAGACSSCGSYDACRGGCMAAKFFTGLELTDPDPECVFGHGETALKAKRLTLRPSSSPDHSRRIPVSISSR
ncbi:MAG TPA: mycofactocin radical SAM maturase [Acidimicrobiales bacterium]